MKARELFMKKKIMVSFAAFTAVLAIAAAVAIGIGVSRNTEKSANYDLPGVVAGDGVLALIDARVSTKEFSEKPIDRQITAEILWTAFGKNSRGKRTIPTSRNQQNLNVYLVTADGMWLYDGMKNQLVRRSHEDLRPVFATQDYVLKAPITLLYTGTDEVNSPIHAGSAYQNVALYAVEKGLGTVVRSHFDKDAVKAAFNLPADEFPITSQTIGWPAE